MTTLRTPLPISWISARRIILALGVTTLIAIILALAALYAYAGSYGLSVLLRRGGSFWVSVTPDDARLSPSMRLALRDSPPEPRAGPFAWITIDAGFDVAELPVLAGGAEVDRILLARIDPARFRFRALSAPGGNKDLRDWMQDLGAVLVINGSYYSRYGTPDTPFVSGGTLLGPAEYDARHGAFIASASGTAIRDLAGEDWRKALQGASDAMVSYPLLRAADGSSRVKADRRWLANRSFVGQDSSGRIVLGTTKDAFFSLERLAAFLGSAPLDLPLALNLDGGPVACQGVALNDYRRDFCGAWETAVHDGDLQLLTWPFANQRWSLPIVLAVERK